MLFVTVCVQGIKMAMNGSFRMQDFFVMLIIGFCVSSFVAPISLPFMFKFGTEKGRMAYFIMIGIVCAGAYSLSTFVDVTQVGVGISSVWFLPLLCAVCVAVYALSWYLSIVFYKKREI